jgi:hypothetical protein
MMIIISADAKIFSGGRSLTRVRRAGGGRRTKSLGKIIGVCCMYVGSNDISIGSLLLMAHKNQKPKNTLDDRPQSSALHSSMLCTLISCAPCV